MVFEWNPVAWLEEARKERGVRDFNTCSVENGNHFIYLNT